MEFGLHHLYRLYNVFRENDGLENCAQLVEEEFMRIHDENDRNIVSMNSLNIHDANDMQRHKLGDAMFDEDDIFSPPSFDEQICYDVCMPPIHDDGETYHHDFNLQSGYVNQ